MPTIKNLTEDTAAVVGLPEDAHDLKIQQTLEGKELFYKVDCFPDFFDLPPGQWSIVGWSDELTYEQKGFICKRENGYFEDYCGDGYLFTSVTLSYVSFLTFHGIKPEDYLLIENKK
jgi:hypothetical protein